LADRRHHEAEKRSRDRVAAIKGETGGLVSLLESNTELTRQDKELTEQVARLTREIHAALTPKG
jgi:signal transduction histidine kinase